MEDTLASVSDLQHPKDIVPKPPRRWGDRECRFTLLSPTQLKEYSSPRWLVRDCLPERSLAVLYGKPSSLKTFIALDMACSIASGMPWHGHSVIHRPVVFVSGEGFSGLPLRLRAWEQAHATSVPENRFRLLAEPVQLLDAEQVDDLTEDIKHTVSTPGLVVIDTLARSFCGDENSAKDMGALVAQVDSLKTNLECTVVLVHHTNKDDDLRGSTALPGAADTLMRTTLSRDKGTVTLKCTKQKDAAAFDPIAFRPRVVELGPEAQSLVLDPTERSISEDADDREDTTFEVLDTLVYLYHDDGVSSGDWRDACKRRGIAKATFHRKVNELVEAGRVVSTKQGRSVLYVPVLE